MGAWASGVGLGALGPTGNPGHLCPSAGCLYAVPVVHLGVGAWEGVCGVGPWALASERQVLVGVWQGLGEASSTAVSTPGDTPPALSAAQIPRVRKCWL